MAVRISSIASKALALYTPEISRHRRSTVSFASAHRPRILAMKFWGTNHNLPIRRATQYVPSCSYYVRYHCTRLFNIFHVLFSESLQLFQALKICQEEISLCPTCLHGECRGVTVARVSSIYLSHSQAIYVVLSG